MKANDALLIVDVQNDFLPGGSLPVPVGQMFIENINVVVPRFNYVFLSRDWHPSITSHFNKWPAHCVQGTQGAEFSPGLLIPDKRFIISKGTEPGEDSYSAFDGFWDADWVRDEREEFGLGKILHTIGINHLYVCGVATEYCVKATVLDACKQIEQVTVYSDAVCGISPTKEQEAFKEMQEAGATFQFAGFYL